MMAINKDVSRCFLLGVTGGIASGKSTVSKMLAELGAPLIDFDLIARQVVAPGTEGLAKIVAYFGHQVLTEDGSMDRKKVANIVFGDIEKRKKLESFTHPLIHIEFRRQAAAIAAENPEAIIQVAVPLLIEMNLQHLFDEILVVYIPAELQEKRLAERDNISPQAAVNIMKSQLPIAEKLQYADFIVDNSGDLDYTKSQVEKIWHELQAREQE